MGPVWAAEFLEAPAGEEKERIKRDAYEMATALMDNLGVGEFAAELSRQIGR